MGRPNQRSVLSPLHLLKCGPRILARWPQLVLLGPRWIAPLVAFLQPDSSRCRHQACHRWRHPPGLHRCSLIIPLVALNRSIPEEPVKWLRTGVSGALVAESTGILCRNRPWLVHDIGRITRSKTRCCRPRGSLDAAKSPDRTHDRGPVAKRLPVHVFGPFCRFAPLPLKRRIRTRTSCVCRRGPFCMGG